MYCVFFALRCVVIYVLFFRRHLHSALHHHHPLTSSSTSSFSGGAWIQQKNHHFRWLRLALNHEPIASLAFASSTFLVKCTLFFCPDGDGGPSTIDVLHCSEKWKGEKGAENHFLTSFVSNDFLAAAQRKNKRGH